MYVCMYRYMYVCMYIKKKKKINLWPLFMDGVQLPQG